MAKLEVDMAATFKDFQLRVQALSQAIPPSDVLAQPAEASGARTTSPIGSGGRCGDRKATEPGAPCERSELDSGNLSEPLKCASLGSGTSAVSGAPGVEVGSSSGCKGRIGSG